MVSYTDPFMLNTNLNYDGSGKIVDQLKGKSFGVDGNTSGDWVAESTTAQVTEKSNNPNDTLINDASNPPRDEIAVANSNTLEGQTGLLEYVVGIDQYTITLKDGTQFSQADFENAVLPVRILDNDRVILDLYDRQHLSVLNGKSPIAKISFPANATQTDGYSGYTASSFDGEYTPAFGGGETNPPCFTLGTLVATPDGERRIETLRPGDLVVTRDNGLQPLRWIGARKINRAALQANPKLRPIRIRAGALMNAALQSTFSGGATRCCGFTPASHPHILKNRSANVRQQRSADRRKEPA